MVQAIDGTIIMTPDLVDSINQTFDYRVPKKWMYDPTGAEISWVLPSLSGWLKGLVDRHYQLSNWLNKERPPSFWLTGFFNGQGFLTAMKQEVTRQHKAENWSLDQVDLKTDVMRDIVRDNPESGRLDGKSLQGASEGVWIHGLFLEGCQWHHTEKRLEEQTAKDIFYLFPVIQVSCQSTQIPTDARGAAARQKELANNDKNSYLCPVYKYPKRNDKYLIFRVYLKAESQGAPPNPNRGMTAPMKWKLAGVCLLCTKE